MNRSYYHKGFIITPGLCEFHPDMWTVMDWRNYDEMIGALPTGICAPTLREARDDINNLLFVQENIPF